jgi:DNA-binding transcriptional LysR family regulator
MFLIKYNRSMQQYDFNLLVALDALLQEGSVRGAAERVNLSAPAMSHTLGRLRIAIGDPLLVRAGQRLVPTPRAIAMRDQVRQMVEGGRAIFENRPLGELTMERRTLTVRANDSVISVFGGRLVQRVQTKAPKIQIRFAGCSEEDVTPLRNGSIDLDIGVLEDMGPEICTERLLQDDFVCVFRSGHPLAKRRLTIAAYAAADHVVSSRRGRPLGLVDAALNESGLDRRVPVIVPDNLAAITLVAASDLIATVPKTVAKWGEVSMGVIIRPMPFSIPGITMFQSWHPRLSADKAHQWLRECMAAVVRNE